ncbi:hypothetical protein GCM10009798_01480 [Nocardioides panacihumi]|uniref:Uncharacterized protein n=1 Tax=Nocardioides panacihumi TaxID=400774 RepID=A0ABN2Q9W4_9ACTN
MATPLPTFVWTDVTGSWANPQPGILLAWRQVQRDARWHWEGWVISAWSGGAPAHGEKVYVHQAWTDAAHIRIADAPRPQPDLSRHRPAHHGRSGLA